MTHDAKAQHAARLGLLLFCQWWHQLASLRQATQVAACVSALLLHIALHTPLCCGQCWRWQSAAARQAGRQTHHCHQRDQCSTCSMQNIFGCWVQHHGAVAEHPRAGAEGSVALPVEEHGLSTFSSPCWHKCESKAWPTQHRCCLAAATMAGLEA